MASKSNIFPSLSQYGCSNRFNETQQWSKGSLRNLSFSLPSFLPPYNVDHSVYVRYLKSKAKKYSSKRKEHGPNNRKRILLRQLTFYPFDAVFYPYLQDSYNVFKRNLWTIMILTNVEVRTEAVVLDSLGKWTRKSQFTLNLISYGWSE